MDAQQLFFERYDGFQEYPERLVSGLDEAQLRISPHPAVNSIAWILWHMVRCEDVCVGRVLTDGRQLLDTDGRSERLGAGERSMGTGMPRTAARELSASIDLAELEAYRVAVVARTRATVPTLSAADLEAVLSPDLLRQVFLDEGVGGALGPEIVTAYTGHTGGWLLGHLVLTHHYYHIGQAFTVRALHGAPSPW